MTPDVKLNARNHEGAEEGEGPDQANKSDLLDDEEDFFDFISRFQSKRMDDQRCSLAVPPPSKPSMNNQSTQNSSSNHGSKPPQSHPFSSHAEFGNKKAATGQPQSTNVLGGASLQLNSGGAAQPGPFKQQKDELLDLIAGVQSHRMNEQRAAVPFLPGLTRSSKQPPELLQRLSVATNNEENFPDESFFEMLMKCQGSRIEEQRSSLPNGSEIQDPILLHARNATVNSGSKNNGPNNVEPQPSVPLPPHAPTVP